MFSSRITFVEGLICEKLIYRSHIFRKSPRMMPTIEGDVARIRVNMTTRVVNDEIESYFGNLEFLPEGNALEMKAIQTDSWKPTAERHRVL